METSLSTTFESCMLLISSFLEMINTERILIRMCRPLRPQLPLFRSLLLVNAIDEIDKIAIQSRIYTHPSLPGFEQNNQLLPQEQYTISSCLLIVVSS
jgi:hypothetical protein